MIEGHRNIKETAELWGITTRLLQVLCSEGRIEAGKRVGDSSGCQETRRC